MYYFRGVTFLISLGLRLDRGKMVRAAILVLFGYLASPLAALCLAKFTDAALEEHTGALFYAIASAILLVAQIMLSHFAHLDYYELAEMQESQLRANLMKLIHAPDSMAHLQNPTFVDKANLVREDLFRLTRSLEALLQFFGLSVQILVTLFILVSLNPWLAVLPLITVVPVLLNRKGQAFLERAREESAEARRTNRHILELATSASSAKEARVNGVVGELVEIQHQSWARVTKKLWEGQLVSAALRVLSQFIVAIGYGGAISLLVIQALAGNASIGDLILVITLAVQVSVQVSSVIGLQSFLQAMVETVRRIDHLRRSSGSISVGSPVSAGPIDPLKFGIKLDRVSFSYGSSDKLALENISLDIPAGSTLAVVGENGSGKSTLINMLCGLYRPSSGKILVDGKNLEDINLFEWQSRISALFQDFYRFEFKLGENIGLGEKSLIENYAAISSAVDRADAQGLVDDVPGGLSGYVGRSYGDGTDLSGGQWQTVGLARSLMRVEPRLLILDEPAAALDPAAESKIFQRYASAPTGVEMNPKSITILVSHRFSTVLMADNIVVLNRGRMVEFGTHAQLLAQDGLYSELFELQARSYQ